MGEREGGYNPEDEKVSPESVQAHNIARAVVEYIENTEKMSVDKVDKGHGQTFRKDALPEQLWIKLSEFLEHQGEDPLSEDAKTSVLNAMHQAYNADGKLDRVLLRDKMKEVVEDHLKRVHTKTESEETSTAE